MSDKLYILAIRWLSTPTPDPDRVSKVLDPISNWSRLNVHVWFVKSAYSAQQITDTVRRVIDSNDGVFVIAADPHDRAGWAPKLIWEWLDTNFPARSPQW